MIDYHKTEPLRYDCLTDDEREQVWQALVTRGPMYALEELRALRCKYEENRGP